MTAWQDLALHLIARLCGQVHALQTSKVFLLAGHEDGQRPFAAMTRPRQARDAVIGECQAWIAQNYVCANPVAAMAERSGLESRTFGRRFRSATGYLPIEYVHALRIEEARRIIETEAGGIDEVGYQVGVRGPYLFPSPLQAQDRPEPGGLPPKDGWHPAWGPDHKLVWVS